MTSDGPKQDSGCPAPVDFTVQICPENLLLGQLSSHLKSLHVPCELLRFESGLFTPQTCTFRPENEQTARRLAAAAERISVERYSTLFNSSVHYTVLYIDGTAESPERRNHEPEWREKTNQNDNRHARRCTAAVTREPSGVDTCIVNCH